MSLEHMLAKFDAKGVYKAGMEFTIDQAFTGSAQLAGVMRTILGADTLTIKTTARDRSATDDYLKLSGTASLLNLTDAGVVFTATEKDDDLLVVLEITIAKGWKFTQSFPGIPGYCDLNEMDGLSLGASKLVFTNHTHHNEILDADLVAGLNFFGELYLAGILYGLGALCGADKPLPLSGPVHEYLPTKDPLHFTGIRLRAPVDFLPEDFPMTLKTSGLLIKNSVSKSQKDLVASPIQDPGIYLTAETEIGGRTVDVISAYRYVSGDMYLSMLAWLNDFDLAGFSALSGATGGDGFSADLPDALQEPKGLQLTELGLDVNVTKPALLGMSVGVGCPVAWELIPDLFTVEEIGIKFQILNPFDRKTRQVYVTIGGQIALVEDIRMAVFATYPGGRVSGRLPADTVIPLGSLVQRLIAGAPRLPAMTIDALMFFADPKRKSYAVTCGISDLLSVQVGAATFELERVAFSVQHDPSLTVGGFGAEMAVAGVNAILSGELADTFTLTGALRDFDLKAFWSLVTDGGALPDEVPDIVFDTLSVTTAPQTGDFSMAGSVEIAWDKLPFEGALSTRIEFSMSVDKSAGGSSKSTAINANLSIQGAGPARFCDGLEMQEFNFLFSYQTRTGWQLGGGATINIFDSDLRIQAQYTQSAARRMFTLTSTAAPEKELIALDGVGRFAFRQFDLNIDRRTLEDKKTRTFWSLRLDSTLEIDHVLAVGGFLSLFDRPDGSRGLLFNPRQGTADASIPLAGGDGAALDIQLVEAGFIRESASMGWSFTGTVKMGFKGLPGWLDQLLPNAMTGKLLAGKTQTRLSALDITDAMPIDLPKSGGQSMGALIVQITEMGLEVRPSMGLMLEAGLGFTEEVNTFFGSQVLRVYQPGNKLSLARTRLTMAASGLAVQFLSSPFAGANAVTINNEAWFNVSLGKCGAVRLKMPTFKYDGLTQYFEAGGGVEVTKPLALPLSPIKNLLKGVKLDAAADVLPDRIPIKSVDIVDARGNLKVDELIDLIEEAGKLPGEVKTILREAGDLLSRFPDDFKQYFNIVVPEKLEFTFGFSPTGRTTIYLATGDTPVRMLTSGGTGPMGIELRKLSLGTIGAGGSLFYLTIDGHIDLFDIINLAASLALPTDPSFPLPTSDQLQRRIVLDNVFMIIPLQAGVPIPIPIFYDRIGLEYMGLEGVGLQGHMGFPQPSFSLLTRFFTELKQFFSDRDYLLDPKTPPGQTAFGFHLENNYIALPEYLGGKILGSKGKPVTIDLWTHIAHALNFCKTISITELIQSIPINQRVGSASHKFAFMSFDADWLITTPYEFKQGAFEQLKLSASDRDDFMDVLPTVQAGAASVAGKQTEGLVVFLRGEADLTVVGLELVFGLAAASATGFCTGFKFTGQVAKMIEMEIGGNIAINSPKAGTSTSDAAVSAQSAQTPRLPLDTPMALALDGRNSLVWIPHCDDFNFNGPFTVEAWVKIDKFDKPWQAIITKGDSAWRLHRYKKTNKVGFSTTGLSNVDQASKTDLRTGQWYHIAAVFNGKQKQLFINGKLDNAVNVKGKLRTNALPVVLGGNAQRAGRLFDGSLFEARVWNKACSAAFIKANMNATLSGKERNLVSWWRPGQADGATVADLCGRNNGIVQAGDWVAWKDAPARPPAPAADTAPWISGLMFNGRDTAVEVPLFNRFPQQNFTLECWIKPSRNSANRALISFAPNRQMHHGLAVLNPNNLQVYINNKSSGPMGVALQPDKWQHLAITWSSPSGVLEVIVDGAQVKKSTFAKGWRIQKSGRLVMGQELNAGGRYTAAKAFNGTLAQCRLWDRVKSADEIRAGMLRRFEDGEKNLAAQWPLSEGGGQTAQELVFGLDGMISAPAWAQRCYVEPQGLRFDGKDDCVQAPDSATLRISRYTVECWIFPENPGNQAWSGILGKPGRNFNIWLHKDGFIHHRFHVGQKTNLGAPNTAKGSIAWQTWSHVAITNDGKTATTYINGEIAAAGPANGVPVIDKKPFIMGRSLDGKAGNYFKGRIDEVRIWSIVRTEDEIAEQMYRMLRGNEPGLAAYWPMEKGSGSQLQDYTGHGNTATIQGAQWHITQAPAQTENALLQLAGHTHLAMFNHRIFEGDVRLVDDRFWFVGKLALFPKNWPIHVNGDVQGAVGKNTFKFSGDVSTELFGLKLTQTKVLASHKGIRIESYLFGAFLVLEVYEQAGLPALKGAVGYKLDTTLNFGQIKVGKIKVADNVRIDIDIDIGLAVKIGQDAFGAGIKAEFKINGKGFDLSFSISAAPDDIADVLAEAVKKITATPMKYLKEMFSDAGKWLENAGKGVIEFADDVGDGMGKAIKAVGATADDAARLLKNAGHDVGKIGKALEAGFNKNADAVAKILKKSGFPVNDIGKGLKTAFNASEAAAAKALKGAGYAAEDVGKAIRQGFTRDAEAAAKALKASGYAVDQVGKAIKNSFTADAGQAAQALKGAGYAAGNVGKALKNTFVRSSGDAAKALKQAGFAGADVGNALKGTFSNSADTVGKALKDAGYAASDVGKVMKNTFNKSAKDTAKFMKNTLKFGDKTVNSALKSAGYAGSQVEGAMKDAFDWGKKAAKDIKKFFGF